MAKARMLHKKISVSGQVNKLSLPAQLLFTWMIAHADDDGKLKGESDYIKAMVVPMKKWSFNSIKKYLLEMSQSGLIHYWDVNSEQFIEFIKWKEHQSIKSDRYKPSDLPSFDKDSGTIMAPDNVQEDSNEEPQSKLIESSPDKASEIKIKKSESKEEGFADKNSPSYKIINPKEFSPSNENESMAFETWKRLEPDNPKALQTTYLKALKLKLPLYKFGEFASEIEQDSTIENKGAIFQVKVVRYLKEKGVLK